MLEHGDVPRLSIIICTYNRAGLLSKTLDSLLGLEMLDKAEVILVDNRSTDNTAAVVKQFMDKNAGLIRMKYLLEPVQGLSAARNAGILAAKASLIAFLDDDALPVRSWISTIVTTFESRPSVMAMGGKVSPIFETKRPNWLIKPFEFPYTIMDLGNRIKEYPGKYHPCGANMAMRSEVFNLSLFPLELGRKGDSLISGEETWLFGKIRKEGQLVLYHPQMAVDHFVPASRLTESWIKKRYYSQGLSNALGSTGPLGTLMIWGKTGAKLLYIAVDSTLSAISGSEGRKLLNKCRMESVRGTLHMLKNRNRESATG
ncbi:Chondroitin synthase [compost metagenome]